MFHPKTGHKCNEAKIAERKMNQRFAELEGQDWKDYDALIRVAKAGKGARHQLQMYGDESKELFELMEALKEVEHLL